MGVPGADLPGLGSSLALSFVSLGMVCLVAFGVLRWLARKGVGQVDASIRLVGRCGLEARKAVYLIEAGGRCFLVGVGDGPMTMLAEIEKSALPSTLAPGANEKAGSAFGEVLTRVLRRRGR